jgi:hypothetical protein
MGFLNNSGVARATSEYLNGFCTESYGRRLNRRRVPQLMGK